MDKWSATMDLFSDAVLKTFLFALVKSIVQKCSITVLLEISMSTRLVHWRITECIDTVKLEL